MNPYKVLEIDENASQQQIKEAYRRLVKKYHPDKYVDNPLSSLAEEKMREINQAYDMLTGASAGSGRSAGGGSSYSSSSSGNSSFNKIRQMINMSQFDQAMTILDNMSNRPAEWYYLKGACMMGKGWYAQAQNFYNMAYQMEPNNAEYRRAATSMHSSNQNFTRQAGTGGADICDICSCLLCTNCCCNSMGGCC